MSETDLASFERTIASRTAYQGRIIRVERLDVENRAGMRSVRDIVRHPGAVAVLAVREDGRFVFVRQFRKAVESTLLEVVAGTLEPDEAPPDCAIRELREETGYECASLRPMGTFFLAPGYSSERIHAFLATVTAGAGAPEPDADEAIEGVCLSADDVARLIREGRIVDAKTLAVWLLHLQHARPQPEAPGPGGGT